MTIKYRGQNHYGRDRCGTEIASPQKDLVKKDQGKYSRKHRLKREQKPCVFRSSTPGMVTGIIIKC